MIQVYKFGGAAVKNAEGVKNLAKIVAQNSSGPLLMVVSAMGETTNALEKLTHEYVGGLSGTHAVFDEIKMFHKGMMDALFEDENHGVYDEVANVFVEIDWILEDEPHPDFDFNYDQIVSVGELVSTRIISAYFNHIGLKNQWLDARGMIQTDNTYREAEVDWNKTRLMVQDTALPILSNKIIVTQGFIGGTSENYTTTLGREGSDYSAAIFAFCLNAQSLTTWKDVPGIYNSDPKIYPDAQKYVSLPYSEALEMAYYGANIIHPKTIKPLQNASIPLVVRSFYDLQETGTIIGQAENLNLRNAAIIVKNNQVLISLSTKDFSFITEDHLSQLFQAFSSSHIKINMMQNSALSFSVCFDWDEMRFEKLSDLLHHDYKIKYNTGLELITIRHHKKELVDEICKDRTVLMEQLSRNTAQLVLKKLD